MLLGRYATNKQMFGCLAACLSSQQKTKERLIMCRKKISDLAACLSSQQKTKERLIMCRKKISDEDFVKKVLPEVAACKAKCKSPDEPKAQEELKKMKKKLCVKLEEMKSASVSFNGKRSVSQSVNQSVSQLAKQSINQVVRQ